MEYVIFLLALVIAVVLANVFAVNRTEKKTSSQIEENKKRADVAEGKLIASEEAYKKFREQEDKRSQKASDDFNELRKKLSDEEKARTAAERDKENAMERLEEEKKLIVNAKEELTRAFKAVAGDALSTNTKQNLEMAKQVLDKVLSDAKGDLGKKQEAISGLVNPLSEKLKIFGEHVRALETKREAAYTGLEVYLREAVSKQDRLTQTISSLDTALRSPRIRGRWGEITLRRVVELAGLSEHCDFAEQVVLKNNAMNLRPDLVVHLSADREVVVDSKVPLDAYLNAMNATGDEEKKKFLVAHAQQVRSHMKSLSEKAYWDQFPKAPQCVIMFIPGESFLAEAAHHDLSLIEDGMAMGVYIATPLILIGQLQAIAHGWRQEQIAANAEVISNLGKQLYERMRILAEHIDGIGTGLTKANESYSKAVSSIESRVLPSARKFKELGAATGEEIVTLKPIEATPRRISLPELPEKDKPTIQ